MAGIASLPGCWGNFRGHPARVIQNIRNTDRDDCLRRAGVRRVRHLAAPSGSDHRLGRGRAGGSEHFAPVPREADQETEAISPSLIQPVSTASIASCAPGNLASSSPRIQPPSVCSRRADLVGERQYQQNWPGSDHFCDMDVWPRVIGLRGFLVGRVRTCESRPHFLTSRS